MSDRESKSLIEGIAPRHVRHEIPAPEREFRPWHKPRKQWVRNEQWRKETESLITKLNLEGRPLRYLSLPGEDLFDIRVLAELCGEKDLRIKCLGYDEAARDRTSRTEVNISWNEVSNNIEATSCILPDKISVLRNVKSQAFSYINELGPFDVINLDLCGSISCINDPYNHEVLRNLCEYQANHSREPWLFFLTTRADYEEVNIGHLPHYLKCLESNARNHPSFRDRLTEVTGVDITRFEQSELLAFLERSKGSAFVRLFAAGFGKWLLRLMSGGANAWLVEMLNSCWYRVENNQTPDSFPNMLSLAFCLYPDERPLVDDSGLVPTNPYTKPNEEDLAMRILGKTEGFIDLDRELDGNRRLYERLETQTINLLRAARYSVDRYPSWSREKKVSFGDSSDD